MLFSFVARSRVLPPARFAPPLRSVHDDAAPRVPTSALVPPTASAGKRDRRASSSVASAGAAAAAPASAKSSSSSAAAVTAAANVNKPRTSVVLLASDGLTAPLHLASQSRSAVLESAELRARGERSARVYNRASAVAGYVFGERPLVAGALETGVWASVLQQRALLFPTPGSWLAELLAASMVSTEWCGMGVATMLLCGV